MTRSVSVDSTQDSDSLTVLASAARTATVTSGNLNNNGYRGLHLIIDATAAAATPSVVVTIQGYSPLGDDYYTILASAAITGTGTTILRVYPGLTAAANLVANDCLPPVWRVNAAHADADSITYSVAALMLP